jgi:hypothetical protein
MVNFVFLYATLIRKTGKSCFVAQTKRLLVNNLNTKPPHFRLTKQGPYLSTGTEDSESNVEDLGKKLDQILRRLDLLEQLILEKPEFEGLTAALRLTRIGIGMYGEPLKIAARLKNAQNYLKQNRIAQDEISRCIIQALAVKGALNISALTRQITSMRGKASRRIVRERVIKLQDQGILIKKEGNPPTYDLAQKD